VKETIDVEIIEEVDYGETSFLDGSSSTQETKNYVSFGDCVQEFQEFKILHRRLRKDTIDGWNKMNGIVYSRDAYYSNYSCYFQTKNESRLIP